MTLPNKLTMLRILLIPVMVIIYYIPWFRENIIFLNISWLYFILFIIFSVASLTDMLDGKIARKYNLVTTFGKFADPLADKLLVFTALTMLMLNPVGVIVNMGEVWIQMVPMWAFIIILIREFMVSGIRMVAASNGQVIAAAKLGKIKTAVTMFAIIICFFAEAHNAVAIIGYFSIMIATVLTIVSGIEYFWKNRAIILESI
jgi:CDP-diacylglycerol--glycerol-3-phosphate 3-phosphatidyltransferase